MKKHLLTNTLMKRRSSAAFAVLFWLTTMAPLMAQIVSFDFESDSIGQMPAGWAAGSYDGNPVIAFVTNSVAASGAKSLFMNDWAGPSQLSLTKSFTNQTQGVFKLTGSARVEQTNQAIAPFTLIDGLNNRFNELDFWSDGTFRYESPHGNFVSTGVAYQPGVFYKFMSWIDMDARRWSFSITDSSGVLVASANNLEFSGNGGSFSKIRSWGVGGSETGAWYIDDIALEVFHLEMAIRVSEVEVCWNSRPDKMYMVQYTSDLTTNLWTDLFTTPIQGSGTNNCITDSVPSGRPQRLYRVVTLP